MKDVYSKILFNCKPEVDLGIKDMKKFEKDLWDIYENWFNVLTHDFIHVIIYKVTIICKT